MKHRLLRLFLLLLALLPACTGGTSGDDVVEDGLPEAGDCVSLDVTVSSEKKDLMTALGADFNADDTSTIDGRCTVVRVQSKPSGGSTQLLVDGWPMTPENGPQPVIWSPAASTWGAILNQRLADRGQAAMAPESAPFMLTPLVIAMPQPMAQALGHPGESFGFADILELARSDAGWADFGHPEWGPFRLGKTNPNFSTSGLSALLAQYYAATGKTSGLTIEDLDRAEVQDFARGVESAVVHYGDTTLTFLNNLYRTDQRGTSLTYASAVAVEEKSVIDYNLGNPDGVLDAGERPTPPRIPLVAIYPEEGTLFSDNPLVILDAPWVSAEQKAAAEAFRTFVQQPVNQQRVLEFGFRPGNPEVAIGAPIVTGNGVDPAQPQTTLEVPDPEVMVAALDRWEEQRKSARVLLVIDVSGSMGDSAGSDGGETKLDLAKIAAVEALDDFADADEVGVRIFSTDISPTEPTDYVDVVPIAPMSGNRERIATAIRGLIPTSGTPLYTVTRDSYEQMLELYDPEKINAIVLLSDGFNDDPRNDDLEQVIATLREGAEGQTTRPVRVFPIAYGSESDLGTLRRIAEATNANAYDSSDATSIQRVFTAVVSNF